MNEREVKRRMNAMVARSIVDVCLFGLDIERNFRLGLDGRQEDRKIREVAKFQFRISNFKVPISNFEFQISNFRFNFQNPELSLRDANHLAR